MLQHSLLLLQRNPLGLGLAVKAANVFAQAHQEHAALGQGPLAATSPSCCNSSTLQDREHLAQHRRKVACQWPLLQQRSKVVVCCQCSGL